MRNATTPLVYSVAAVAVSLFWITRQPTGGWNSAALSWLLMFAAPLLFVFAYPRFLFAAFPAPTGRARFAAIFHGLASAIATILFVTLGSAFWKNPVRDANAILLLAIPLVALPVFLVAALSLLLKGRSTLAKFASFLFWPYWLLLALTLVGRFFEASLLHTAFCFLCFLTPILLAFAAGAISYRPAMAHASALAGLVAMPWIYWTTLQDTPLGNVWTTFNVPDREFPMDDNPRIAELIILSISLIVLALGTAALRLLPARWNFRSTPLCERTWPAVGASFVFLAIWFSQSVMPYRVSGAVDFGSWPIFQILHVEKRGLQFHETCINIKGYRKSAESVSFSGNDRRLFQYRFQQTLSSGDLPEPLKQRIQALMQSSETAQSGRETVKPLRVWNDDGWYVSGQAVGLKVYVASRGTTPPREIVDIFNELEKLPRAHESQSAMKDVCLGFCYDPLSALGSLYANHRCRYDGHDYVCR